MESSLALGIALLLAPVLPGVILKVKALFAGKTGPPLLIRWYTLIKLLRKGSVYSDSTGFVFRLGPVAGCATALLALLFFPFAGLPPLLSFTGDIIVVLYALGLGRFCTVLAALDTASPFEGMGAAREVFFASLAEIGLFVVLILFHRMGGGLSLAGWFAGPQAISLAGTQGALLLLVVVALFLLLLAENSRVPVDDPATHLELTMIHEVMVLDHSGPAFGLILYGAALKLFVLGAFFMHLASPFTSANPLADWGIFVVSMLLLAVAIGVVESVMARLRLVRVPQLLVAATILAAFSTLLVIR